MASMRPAAWLCRANRPWAWHRMCGTRLRAARAIPTIRMCSTRVLHGREDENDEVTKAFAVLPRRTIVAVRGDATSFLQGIVTADVVNLQEGAATSALMLTPQGRIVHEMMITSDGMGGMLLEVENSSKESLVRALNVYRLQANVEIHEEDMTVFAVMGEDASIATCLSASASGADERCPSFKVQRVLTRDPEATLKELCAQEFLHANEKMYHQYRLLHGIAEGFGEDGGWVKKKTIPLEAAAHHFNAISFSKGCYVGQELIARTYYKGVLRKSILPVIALKSSDLEEPDALQQTFLELPALPIRTLLPKWIGAARHAAAVPPLDSDLKYDGERRSAGKIVARCGNVGLAMLRVEQVNDRNGAAMVTDEEGVLVQPIKPHWWSAHWKRMEEAARMASIAQQAT